MVWWRFSDRYNRRKGDSLSVCPNIWIRRAASRWGNPNRRRRASSSRTSSHSIPPLGTVPVRRHCDTEWSRCPPEREACESGTKCIAGLWMTLSNILILYSQRRTSLNARHHLRNSIQPFLHLLSSLDENGEKKMFDRRPFTENNLNCFSWGYRCQLFVSRKFQKLPNWMTD